MCRYYCGRVYRQRFRLVEIGNSWRCSVVDKEAVGWVIVRIVRRSRCKMQMQMQVNEVYGNRWMGRIVDIRLCGVIDSEWLNLDTWHGSDAGSSVPK